jgi:predicted O-methyltransferase YrrM
VARENLQLAGVDQRVTLREGPALQSLEALGECPAFDLIFIDADKPNNPIICAGRYVIPAQEP